jgi:hypothetical protein
LQILFHKKDFIDLLKNWQENIGILILLYDLPFPIKRQKNKNHIKKNTVLQILFHKPEALKSLKRFFSETTWTVETKLPRNDHWKVLCFLCWSEIQDGRHHRSNCPSGFREEVFWNIFPIGSNVKLSPAVAAILNFISEQKT